MRVSQSNPAANQPIVVMPADGSVVNVSLWAVATNTFIPTTYTWAQVTPEINSWATAGVAAFSATQTSTPNVVVSLPKSGIYQFRVTAKSSDNRVVSSYVWVNAWESKTAIAPGNIGRNPGLTPPPSVRMLSADPGPFQHPRLLFTKGDWPELSSKSNPGAGTPESADQSCTESEGEERPDVGRRRIRSVDARRVCHCGNAIFLSRPTARTHRTCGFIGRIALESRFHDQSGRAWE